MITAYEFSRARSACLRRETLSTATGKVRQRGGALWWVAEKCPPRVKSVTRNHTITRLEDSEATKIPTACWQWDSGRDRHLISIGNKLDEVFFAAPKTPGDLKTINLVKSAIAHEVCHAAYTSLDRRAINDRLDANKLRFKFHNLVEDCRIEWKYIKERGKDHRFGWNRLNELPGMTQPTNVASTYLWQLKCREPALFKSISTAAAPLEWTGLPKFVSGLYEGESVTKIIQKFYARFVAAPDEEALIPIERDWVDVFGHDVEEVTGICDFDEAGGLKAAAASGKPPASADSSSTAGPSACSFSDGHGATGSVPTLQGDFMFPGDVPFDPKTHHESLSPITVFFC